MATYQEERLAEIADAIREKEKSSEPIVATQFAERIAALETGTSGVRSFNGRTGAVEPGFDDYTAEMVGALSEDGGRLYGDLRIQPSGSYGGKLNFGDGDFVFLAEPREDELEVVAKRINFVTSDVTDKKFTLNGEPIGGVDKSQLVTSFNGRQGDIVSEASDYSPEFIGAVPTYRKINQRELISDIELDSNDIPFSRDSGLTIMNKFNELQAADANNAAQASSEIAGVRVELLQKISQLETTGGGVQFSEVANLLNRTTAVNVANTSYSTIMARGIYAGTSDMTPNSTPLTSGVIYLQYE